MRHTHHKCVLYVTTPLRDNGEPDARCGINVLYCYLEKKTGKEVTIKHENFGDIAVYTIGYEFEGYSQPFGTTSMLCNQINKEERHHRYVVELWKLSTETDDDDYVYYTVRHGVNCQASSEDYGNSYYTIGRSSNTWNWVEDEKDFRPRYSENAFDFVKRRAKRGFHVYCGIHTGLLENEG